MSIIWNASTVCKSEKVRLLIGLYSPTAFSQWHNTTHYTHCRQMHAENDFEAKGDILVTVHLVF